MLKKSLKHEKVFPKALEIKIDTNTLFSLADGFLTNIVPCMIES